MLITAIIWVVFGQVAWFEFINLDDPQYVELNSHVHRLSGPNFRWAWTTFDAANWHPLTWLSLMLDAHVFGLRPGAFHLTNLILHTLNVWLLFAALKTMTGAVWRSACVAALFAVHPLHVESVAWIAERKDVLSACFGFLSLWMYALHARRNGRRWHALTLLFFVLSLLSKPMLVTWPCVFLLLDYWPLSRADAGERGTTRTRLAIEKLPLLAISALFCVVAIFAQRAGSALQDLETYSFAARLENVVVAYVLYLYKTVWPQNLAVFYPHPGATLPWAEVATSALLLAGITSLAVMFRRRHPYLLIGWLWFLGTLVPVIGLVQVGEQQLADRYTYVPLVGVFIAVVWLVHDLAPAGVWRGRVLPALGCLFVAACMAVAWRQTSYWSNSLRLFEHTAAVTRPNAFMEFCLGGALEEAERRDAARVRYDRALALDPRSTAVLDGLGSWCVAEGRLEEACEFFRRALAINPQRVETRLNLANAYGAQGQIDRALAEFELAVAAAPNNPACHVELGNALRAAGRADEALPHYRQAVEVAKDSPFALTGLGVGLAELKRDGEAAACFAQALRIDPSFANAHLNLGMLRDVQGRFEEALSHLEEAFRHDPRNETIRRNLAVECVNVGAIMAGRRKLERSLELFHRALQIVPDLSEAHYELARALALQGNLPEADERFRRVLELRPDFAEAHFERGLLLERLNRNEEAVREFEQALQHKSDLTPAHEALRRIQRK